MKDFLKKALVFSAIIAAVSLTFAINSPLPTSADTRSDGSACSEILGMTNWDCGVAENISSEGELVKNIATIAMNVLKDLSVFASYLVLLYVIWGGYLYMFSSGDPGKAAAGKKTIINAFIGLAITVSASTIFSAIRIALIGNSSLGICHSDRASSCINPGTMVTNLVQWVAGMGGIVAAIFIVVGGWGYITSSGDPGKLQKAKSTIIYALIGLLIVALAEIITAFIASTLREANEVSVYQSEEISALSHPTGGVPTHTVNDPTTSSLIITKEPNETI